MANDNILAAASPAEPIMAAADRSMAPTDNMIWNAMNALMSSFIINPYAYLFITGLLFYLDLEELRICSHALARFLLYARSVPARLNKA